MYLIHRINKLKKNDFRKKTYFGLIIKPTMAELKQRILDLLSSPEVDPITRQPKADGSVRSPMKTSDIAKELNTDTKTLNPILYKMLSLGLLVKSDTNGKAPHWTVAKLVSSLDSDDNINEETKEEVTLLTDEEARTQILEILQESQNPVATKVIAKKLYGNAGRPKMVNSILHRLLNKGEVQKFTDNGYNPRWTLVQAPPKPAPMKPPAQVQLRIVS